VTQSQRVSGAYLRSVASPRTTVGGPTTLQFADTRSVFMPIHITATKLNYMAGSDQFIWPM